MKINIDMEKYNALSDKSTQIELSIKKQKEELDCVSQEIKKLFPKGYWWTFDIDPHWKRPKKYSIREISNGCVTVKEVFKKAPWSGFTGLSILTLEQLLELDVYKTEEEAKVAAYNRPCPKCGGPMKYTTNVWCEKCLDERRDKVDEYRRNHMFYEPNKKHIYSVGYTDELTRDIYKGFGGKRFVFKRLDTGEIIETDNLWSEAISSENTNNLPFIEFIKT